MKTAARLNSYNWLWITLLWAGLAIVDASNNVFAMRHQGMHHAWMKVFLCRIHRSTIVNLRRVRALQVDNGGEYEVILESGQKLRLSRRFRKDLQSRMRQFRGALF